MHPAHPLAPSLLLAFFARQLDAQRARCRTEAQWEADPEGMARQQEAERQAHEHEAHTILSR